ncbi:GNAT family N-acetyltransferase [Alkalihalobacillus sp. LMS39]|uniref:GNAT family N-acetyltransferase n=1 Tax=Alkalihalobacillus sp. LMS39 TaxID=2924032 RepID=UPI001FB48068|nr:GNAT family N-acetyltransferase [Alkalihalobacillus sp. LMS39]UOE95245.1 GNAT family N-acetyltransferase [Alkalihalobacillus sp. LMS39]
MKVEGDIMIRTYRAEDKEYIVNAHYDLYNSEFGYDLSFRHFIEESVNGFIERTDCSENIFVLEKSEKQKGSISIKKVNDKTAQLGLFLVDPSVRGAGYGLKLVEAAINFSKEKGYEKVILWTNSELKAARTIYEKFGFTLMKTQPQKLSGKELIEEKWELMLLS